MAGYRYNWKGDKKPSIASVIKIWFGTKKYFIWKGMALWQTAEQVSKDIDRKLRLGCPDTDLFAHVIHYIKYARSVQMDIEVISQSEKPEELLLIEHDLLQAGATDEMCLNNHQLPYIPKWIPQTAVLAYEGFLKARKAAKRKTAKSASKKAKGRKTSPATRKSSHKAVVKPQKGSAKKPAPAKSKPVKKKTSAKS